MPLRSFAAAARREGMLRGMRYRALTLATALLGTTFSLLAAEAVAQQPGVFIGGLTPGGTVCNNANGKIFSENAGPCNGKQADDSFANGDLSASGNVTVGGNLNMTNGNINAVNNINGTGTIVGGTLVATTGGVNVLGGGVNVLGGGITVLGGNLNMTGNSITGVGTITAATGDFTTVNATTGSITTLNSDTIVNTGNIATATLATSGQALLNSLEVTNNAEVKGDLTVGGNLDMTGGDITNVGNISATTGSFTQVNATQVNATQVNATQVNATEGNITTLNSTTIVNTGNIATTTLSTTGNASIGGDLDMTGGRITNVADPILGTDAANKQYVDAGLASAFKEIDRNTQGIAIAMAMAGLTLPDGKNFALGANMGFFEDKQAVAIQTAIRINPNLTFVGGFGTGVQDLNTVGGRIGLQAAW